MPKSHGKTDAKHSIFLNHLPTHSPYHYEILQHKHLDALVKMFTHAFCDSEPMTHYIGMEYHNFTPFARTVAEKAAQDGLSIIALSGHEVVACALVEDLTSPAEFKFELDPKFKYIFSLLEHLSVDFLAKRQFSKSHIAHLFITAVDKAHRGQKLSEQVNFRAMALAEQKGFSFMCSELTNFYNEKGIIPHLPFARLLMGAQVYKDFIFEGTRPFENLAGSATGYIWALRKDAKLHYSEQHKKHEALLESFE